MSKEEISAISTQRNQVFKTVNGVELIGSCSIDSGILQPSSELVENSVLAFERFEGKISFFIPASGSGSRMFQFLHEFVNEKQNSKKSDEFFEKIEDFAFVGKLPIRVREKIGGTENSSIAQYLLSEAGMGFSTKPKGLIPFHVSKGRILNPFQIQVLQAYKLAGDAGVVHFTIQKDFEEQVKRSISEVNRGDLKVEFSTQSSDTDAFCFNEDGMPLVDNESYLRRPAGHGALLENLNQISADLVLIKNIDNVQPIGRETISLESWKLVAGTLISFKKDLIALHEKFDSSRLKDFCEKFQFVLNEDIDDIKKTDLEIFLKRPTRVCGMVKNEGAPGGGPFWVKDKGIVSKQIVEMSQIDDSPAQQNAIKQSSHFNPVFMAVSKSDAFGKNLDLFDFVDESKFLKVKKSHKGQDIFYRELPGLWNGSMANWNTIFIELPSDIFSPVKSVLDLLRPPHL